MNTKCPDRVRSTAAAAGLDSRAAPVFAAQVRCGLRIGRATTRSVAMLVTGLTAVLVAGCASAPVGERSDDVSVLTTIDGILVHLPPETAGAPLVVVLHGLGGQGSDMTTLGWGEIADRDGAVIAYPDGVGKSWNAGMCCGTARDTHVDDVGRLDALVAGLHRRLGTDARRTYAVGFSNGAMMSYAWACARPGRLAGIGLVSGTRVTDCPDPGPVAVVAVHGDSDTVVPLRGGVGPNSATGVAYPPVDEALQPFRSPARCAAVPGCGVSETVLPGLGHTWPGDGTEFLWDRLRGASR